jgi:hypothetical protein
MDKKYIYERVGKIVYIREFGENPINRKIYKILD